MATSTEPSGNAKADLAESATTHSSRASTTSGSGTKTRILEDKELGKFLYTPDATKRQVPPKVQETGIYPANTEYLGPKPNRKKGEITIMSNYVTVKQVPDKLLVYSLTFWRPHPEDPAKKIVYSKRREIEGAFKAVMAADALKLDANQRPWATNYRDLWCQSCLPSDPSSEGKDLAFDTERFTYVQLNGQEVTDLRATVLCTGVLADIEQVLNSTDIAAMSDHIRALNAHVAQGVHQHDNGTDRLFQHGANKFFAKDGFNDMMDANGNRMGVRVMRGYYSSIRPGYSRIFLNVKHCVLRLPLTLPCI